MTEKVTVTKESGPEQILVEISGRVVLWPGDDEGTSEDLEVGSEQDIRIVARGAVDETFELSLTHADPATFDGQIGADGEFEQITTFTVT